jgi:hypothetical protein
MLFVTDFALTSDKGTDRAAARSVPTQLSVTTQGCVCP